MLDAALALLADRGLAAMSVDAVCERSGVSKATIYRHWGSKERLCIEAVSCAQPEEADPDMQRADAGADREPDDARAALVASLQAFITVTDPAVSGRLLARLVGEAVDNPELAQVWRARIIAPRRARLAALVARAVDQGDLRPDTDIDLAVDLLLGPLLYRRLVTGTVMPAPEQLVDVVWDGFRRRRC